MRLRYTIPIPPVTKKNSQQILRSAKTGKPFVAPSKKYREYEAMAEYFVHPVPGEPVERAVNVRCLFYMPTLRRVDLVNLLEAADDLLVHCGVLADDSSRVVAGHDGSRVLYDREHPRTEVEITEVGE